MTQAAETSRPTHTTVLTAFGVLQVIAYGSAVFVSADLNRFDPLPTVVAFGAVLAQCSLAAAFAVLGPGKLPLRMICSGTVVVVGGLVVIMADAPMLRAEVVLVFGLLVLLMWGIIQMPLWMCRLLLRARVIFGDGADNNPARSQYGIRQLMVLTLVVSLVLGLGRMLAPVQALEALERTKIVDWIVFGSIASAAGLIVTTTIMTTLNPRYWRAGIAVSAVSSALIAYGIYSVFALLSAGPANNRILFAVMLLCTYAWLQISVLLVRAAGYRIVVGPK